MPDLSFLFFSFLFFHTRSSPYIITQTKQNIHCIEKGQNLSLEQLNIKGTPGSYGRRYGFTLQQLNMTQLTAERRGGKKKKTLSTGFSLRILIAGERCNVTGQYFERGFLCE